MADDAVTTTTTPEPTTTAAPALSPEVQHYIAQLEAYRDNMETFRSKAEPYADDVQRLIEDAEYRDFTKQSWETFQEAKKRAKPALSADAQAVIETVKPALEYVQSQQEREKKAAEAQQAAYVQEQQAYARKLMAEEGLSTDDIEDLAAIAIQKKTNLEGAWKRLNTKYTLRQADTPPTSLRADAATPGVPGRSDEKPATTRDDFLAGLKRAAKRAMAR